MAEPKGPTYDELIAIGAVSLADDEFWVIDHDEGPLSDTASKDFTAPVRLICMALDMDWDDLQEQGYRLGKWRRLAVPPPPVSEPGGTR